MQSLSMDAAAEKLRQFAAAATAAIESTRAHYFNTNKKGEIFELKADLNSEFKSVKKEAVKQVIANMTVGKDVSGLFADVLKCIQTEDLELKKLVYLYLMNYAKTQPEVVILAVNTFCKDTEDRNPLIRALAIRTMGCLRVDKIIDYLCEPLRKGLQDDNPYVRKTAAIAVAKLYDLSPTLAEDNGFIATLQEMLSDANPMVVSNAVAALTEIQESAPDKNAFTINTTILTKLLAALNEATEWGQIFILDALSDYAPADEKEAELIVERVVPRLQHANGAVVLSAVKVLMVYLDNFVRNAETVKQVTRKMAPPLVTLLSSVPEAQFVALRNINLILQRRSDILANEIRVFFCKYNDPPYVKHEKLEIMVKLCRDANVEQVLAELKEYASEVDVDFVRRSIRAIGRCAVKIDTAAERCVNVLLDLIKTKVNYVVQESIIVIKDIFRKYPHVYEGIIPLLCENLDSLDEPEAKASMIWIVGEYAERIENADALIQHFFESFLEEPHLVQLQLLTAAVKLFLKKPDTTQGIVQTALQTATQKCENADLRDRAYVYWRLLSSDPQIAKAVVLSEKPPVQDDTGILDETLLSLLIANISTLASVYHKPPSSFVGAAKAAPIITMKDVKNRVQEALTGSTQDLDGAGVTGQQMIENLLDLDFPAPIPSTSAGSAPSATNAAPSAAAAMNILDLLGEDLIVPPTPTAQTAPVPAPVAVSAPAASSGLSSPQSQSPVHSVANASAPAKQVWLAPAQGSGLEILGSVTRRPGAAAVTELTFVNHTQQPISDFAIQFNKNAFGLQPGAALQVPALQPGAKFDTALLLSASPAFVQAMQPANALQVAIKSSLGVAYFQAELSLQAFFADETPAIEPAQFGAMWQAAASGPAAAIPPARFISPIASIQEVQARLTSARLRFVTQTSPENLYFALQLVTQVPFLIEVQYHAAQRGIVLTARSPTADFVTALYKTLEPLLH